MLFDLISCYTSEPKIRRLSARWRHTQSHGRRAALYTYHFVSLVRTVTVQTRLVRMVVMQHCDSHDDGADEILNLQMPREESHYYNYTSK